MKCEKNRMICYSVLFVFLKSYSKRKGGMKHGRAGLDKTGWRGVNLADAG